MDYANPHTLQIDVPQRVGYKKAIWGFPKLRGTFLEVPRIRIIVYWGLHWGPLVLGNYHIVCSLGEALTLPTDFPGRQDPFKNGRP